MMIRIIYTYQITVWLIAQIAFIRLFIKTLSLGDNYSGLLLIALMIIFSILFIYSNVCLLFNFKRAYYSKFLRLNIWTNFLQIFNLSLIGFTYYLAIGPYVLFYFSYDINWDLGISLNSFASSFAFKYFDSNVIYVGFELIPLIFFILLNRLNKRDLMNKTENIANYHTENA